MKEKSSGGTRKKAQAASGEPLVPNVKYDCGDDHVSIREANPIQLYNPDACLEISRDVADGFLILLSGGLRSARILKEQMPSKKKKKQGGAVDSTAGESTAQSPSTTEEENDSMVAFAFAALTEGNAVNAVFGVESNGGMKRGKNTSEQAFNAANQAKAALMDASLSSDSICELAVETYAKCFEIIVNFGISLDKIGYISYCMKSQKVREEATQELQRVFDPLNEAVAASI